MLRGEKARRVFLEQGRFFQAFAPQIKASTNHAVRNRWHVTTPNGNGEPVDCLCVSSPCVVWQRTQKSHEIIHVVYFIAALDITCFYSSL